MLPACWRRSAKAAERPVSTCGHIAALKPLFDSDLTARFCELLDVPPLQGWCGDGLEPLLAAMIAHHGKPVSLSFNPTGDRALHAAWLVQDGDDPFAHLNHLLGTGRQLFATAFAEGSPLPAAPAFQHLFAGLLMLADWLGSGSTVEMFPFSEADDGPRAAFARRRASEVLGQVGLHVKPLTHGLVERALRDRPRPGGRPKLGGKDEAFLVALACSAPPEGRARWTMQLLADRLVALELVDAISDETVRRTLKKS